MAYHKPNIGSPQSRTILYSLFSSLNILCAKQLEHFINNLKNIKILQSRLHTSAISETQDLQNKIVITCYQNNKSTETIVQGDFCPRKHLPVKSLLNFFLIYWDSHTSVVYSETSTKSVQRCVSVSKVKQKLNILYKTIQDYIGQTELFKTIQDYTGLYMTIHGYTGLYRTIHYYARLYRTIYDYTRLYKTIQDYIKLYRTI